MGLFKRLFGKKAPDSTSTTEIEDVRRNPTDEGEVILNLWYETDGSIISSLRSKAYVASGSDQEKLTFLQRRANTDFAEARVHGVPDSLKTEIKLVGGG